MQANAAVNPQITDAVTQTNVKVVGEAPAMAMGNVYQTMAHSTGIRFENEANSQTNSQQQSATTQSVPLIYAPDTDDDPLDCYEIMSAPYSLTSCVDAATDDD